MPTVEKDVFTYDELSDHAKQKAREWYQETENEDFGSDPCLLEFANTAASLLGIDDMEMSWSGFWCQGDGASFSGTFQMKPDCPETIRAEFPTDTKLHEIADALKVFHVRYIVINGSREWTGKITKDGRYSHEYSMSAEVFDADGEEMAADTEEEFLEIMRDFARWIYRGLKAEYEYRTSDEAAEEAIRANEYEFDEDGDVI